MNRQQKLTIVTVIVGLLVIVAAYFCATRSLEESEAEYSRLQIGQTTFEIEVADSMEERIQGLSGRESLNEGAGLFFVFPEPDFHGIWMKDMRFAIDILWFDSSLSVVHLEEEVTPETYPEIFLPPLEALYVLEVPAGSVLARGIKIGDEAELF